MREGHGEGSRDQGDGRRKPSNDPELDAAILRVPYWRALGLGVAILLLMGPALWFLLAGGGLRDVSDVDWLDGSDWRIVEIDGRLVAREAQLSFKDGRVTIAADGCTARSFGYRLTPSGISLSLPAKGAVGERCGQATADMAWERLSRIEGLTRYGTGMALTDKDGRNLIRLRR